MFSFYPHRPFSLNISAWLAALWLSVYSWKTFPYQDCQSFIVFSSFPYYNVTLKSYGLSLSISFISNTHAISGLVSTIHSLNTSSFTFLPNLSAFVYKTFSPTLAPLNYLSLFSNSEVDLFCSLLLPYIFGIFGFQTILFFSLILFLWVEYDEHLTEYFAVTKFLSLLSTSWLHICTFKIIFTGLPFISWAYLCFSLWLFYPKNNTC